MITATETVGLEKHLQALVRAQGSDSPLSIELTEREGSLSAHINYVTSTITLELSPHWDPEQYQHIKQFAKRLRIRDLKKKVCEDVSFHEVGHKKLKDDADGLGCCEDLEGKEVAVEAVTTALLEEGKYSLNGALYLENIISDIINNLNGSNYTHFNGLSIFLAEQGELNHGTFSPLYDAFVSFNQRLWGRKPQRKLLSPYYIKNQTKRKSIDEAIGKICAELNLTSERQHNLKVLFNREQWPNIFYTFAKHLAQFMDTTAPEWLPGSGNGGQGYKVPVKFSSKPQMDPKEVKDPEMKRVLDPDNLKRVMLRRNNSGEKSPLFVENWRALDYLYQALASEIWIKAETPQKGFSLPIAPIQSRRFDPKRDDLDKILFGRIMLDEK